MAAVQRSPYLVCRSAGYESFTLTTTIIITLVLTHLFICLFAGS